MCSGPSASISKAISNSDASAALRGGRDIRAALIGAGVFASHGYERSHYEGVENCMKLVYLYLTEKQ